MLNQDYPSLNGIAPSWADLQITFAISGGALLDIADISALNWMEDVEVGEQRGVGPRVRARTQGTLTQEASGTFYLSGMKRLLRGLMVAAPVVNGRKKISLVAFNILVQYTPPGESELYQYALDGCRYLGAKNSTKEGSDADTVEIKLNPIEIAQIIDGQRVVLL